MHTLWCAHERQFMSTEMEMYLVECLIINKFDLNTDLHDSANLRMNTLQYIQIKRPGMSMVQ